MSVNGWTGGNTYGTIQPNSENRDVRELVIGWHDCRYNSKETARKYKHKRNCLYIANENEWVSKKGYGKFLISPY